MNFKNTAFVAAIGVMLMSCGEVLEKQKLSVDEASGTQQNFNLKPQALNLEAVKQLNASPYLRKVMVGGIGQTARLVSEQSVLGMSPPNSTEPIPYKIGVGDDLELVIFVTTKGVTDTARENAISRTAKVGADGSLLFLETGRIDVIGKTLSEARELVGNALVRNGVDPRFQLEVTNFNSQKINLTLVKGESEAGQGVSVSVDSGIKGTGSYVVTERPMTLRELLVTSGLEISRSGVQSITIDRDGRRYQMTVEHVFSEGSPDYYLTGGDTLRLEKFSYGDDKAYILGGGSTPTSIFLSAEARPTLADILFVDGGPFATKTARSKEIYLLRGIDPMSAYHLDAGDPTRIMIAAELELRPNDIVFLSSKPIYELGDFVSTLNPLAVIAASLGN